MIWSYSYSADIWPALITLALAIYLGSYSRRRRDIPTAKPFIIACFFGGFWTLGVILELSAVDFSTKVFRVKFQAIWQLPLVTAIACFVLQYVGRRSDQKVRCLQRENGRHLLRYHHGDRFAVCRLVKEQIGNCECLIYKVEL